MGWLAVTCLILLFVSGMEGMPCSSLWLTGSLTAGIVALYEYASIKQVVFQVTDEQLIVRKGVFYRSCDYIELYRIIDFTEHQDLIQLLMGLKTVTVFSTDRANPSLSIIGLRSNRDIVSLIRQRVIHNRSIRNIHEFSNLF